jgi:hypothetical protein
MEADLVEINKIEKTVKLRLYFEKIFGAMPHRNVVRVVVGNKIAWIRGPVLSRRPLPWIYR